MNEASFYVFVNACIVLCDEVRVQRIIAPNERGHPKTPNARQRPDMASVRKPADERQPLVDECIEASLPCP